MPVTSTIQQDSVLPKHLLQGKSGGGTVSAGGGGGGGNGASNVLAHYDVQTAYNLACAPNSSVLLAMNFPNPVKISTSVALPFAWTSDAERMIRVEAFFVAMHSPNLSRHIVQVLRGNAGKSHSIAFNAACNENAGEIYMSIAETIRVFQESEIRIALALHNTALTAQNLHIKRGEVKILSA